MDSAHLVKGKKPKKAEGGDRSPPEGPFSGNRFTCILVSKLGSKIGPNRVSRPCEALGL
jgi:hypothetical protein